jgi:hypothetical protein
MLGTRANTLAMSGDTAVTTSLRRSEVAVQYDPRGVLYAECRTMLSDELSAVEVEFHTILVIEAPTMACLCEYCFVVLTID